MKWRVPALAKRLSDDQKQGQGQEQSGCKQGGEN
jgi:hypothetical protein